MSSRKRLVAERFTRQALSRRPCTGVAEAAAVTTAIQAQDNQAGRLGLRSRAAGTSEAAVASAIAVARTVVRTWLMRGTVHLVDTHDLRWLQGIFGPAVERRYRTRWRQIGLHDDLLDASVSVLPEILAAGPLTRHEIVAALVERGVVFDSPDPQAPTHLVVHACTTGLMCRGPERGRHSTFALVDKWVPDAPAGPSGDDALAELARRYFDAFSPATAADFTTWSGLGSSRPIALIRDELTPCDVDGLPGFRRGEVDAVRGVRLLAGFDNYLLGYRHRAAIITADRHPSVFQGGIITPTLVVDGVVSGRWALNKTKRTAQVTVSPFAALPTGVLAAVDAEVSDIARFLGRDVELRVAEPA